MAIGKRIKFCRNRKGMTQKQLGEILGFLGKTSDVRMAQYESEARAPKHDLVKEMANLSISAPMPSPCQILIPHDGRDARPGTQRGRTKSTVKVVLLAGPHRRRWRKSHHSLQLHSYPSRRKCEPVPERNRVWFLPDGRWLSGVQQSKRNQSLLLLGPHLQIPFGSHS